MAYVKDEVIQELRQSADIVAFVPQFEEPPKSQHFHTS